jgi:uncharacterized protein
MTVSILFYILLGLCAGIFSGLVGIGGGIIAVPALVFFFGFSQQQAQGTTLAMMLPPIGVLAAWAYYDHGYVDIKVALLLALGFLFGGYIGAKFAISLPTHILQKVFATFLMLISIRLFIGK